MSPPSKPPREDPQRVAVLLIVLRQVIAEVIAAGGKLKGTDRLLAQLDAWLERGGSVRELEKAAVRLYKLGDPWRRPLSGGPETIEDHACAAAHAASSVCRLIVDNFDTDDFWVLHRLTAGVPLPDHPARQKHVAELLASAKAQVAALPVAVATRPAPRKAPAERSDLALLEKSRRALAPPLRPLLDRLRAERRPRRHGERDALQRLLRRRGYEPHAAALDFEETFGGLVLPEPGVEHWSEGGQYTVFGPWTWLHENDDGARPGGDARSHIPVFVDPRGMGRLGPDGRAEVEDEIEGPLPDLDLPSGEALVSMTILFLLTQGPPGRTLPGDHGSAWARSLGAKRIPCLSRTRWRWWACESFAVKGDGSNTQAWALAPGKRATLAKLRG